MTLRDRDINEDMVRYMPDYYEDFPQVQDIIAAEAEMLVGASEQSRSLLRQFFVAEADEFGIRMWERIFDIPTDRSKPLGERRSVVLSKMRGRGTVTKTFVRDVAESYGNGEVEVTENFSAYEVIITFVDTRGIPPNLGDAQEALRDIVPAHLALVFEFTYLTYAELAEHGGTYGDVAAQGMTYGELKSHKYA